MDINIQANGATLPAGALRQKVSLDGAESFTIRILSVHPENGYDENDTPILSERMMAQAQYPDGFIKNHQVATLEDLATKISGQLRGRYGVGSFSFSTLTDGLKAGEITVTEVKYDD